MATRHRATNRPPTIHPLRRSEQPEAPDGEFVPMMVTDEVAESEPAWAVIVAVPSDKATTTSLATVTTEGELDVQFTFE